MKRALCISSSFALLLVTFARTQPVFGEAPPLLTLEEAVERARSRHPNVLAQSARVELAGARVDRAWSGFLPFVAGSFSYNRQTADVATFEVLSYWQGSLTLNWVPFEWGRTFYAYRGSKLFEESQKLGLEAQRLETGLDVKLAYFAALAAAARVAVSEEDVTARKRHSELARSLYTVGARTQIDVLSAESEVAAAELRLARDRGEREAAFAQLLASIGDPEWREYKLVAPQEPASPPPPSDEEAIKEALATRPEPFALGLEAGAFAEVESSVLAQLFPNLFVAAGPGVVGSDLGSLTPNLGVEVGISFPLGGLNPFAVAGELGEAQANQALLNAQKDQAENRVRLETAQARALLIAARQAIESAKRLVETARARRDLAEQRYKAGIGSILELSDAELVFSNARSEQVRAFLEAATARARLDRALGRP